MVLCCSMNAGWVVGIRWDGGDFMQYNVFERFALTGSRDAKNLGASTHDISRPSQLVEFPPPNLHILDTLSSHLLHLLYLPDCQVRDLHWRRVSRLVLGGARTPGCPRQSYRKTDSPRSVTPAHTSQTAEPSAETADVYKTEVTFFYTLRLIFVTIAQRQAYFVIRDKFEVDFIVLQHR